jgi:exonuclease SbcD
MKILHTSDWHLGQKFISRDRDEEHALALDWLIEIIKKEQVDVLLVAGDIFDIGNPPNSARALYYNFLKKLCTTKCKHTVITGGNHDSPYMLNAPKELLQLLDVHVIGCATEQLEDEILLLKDSKRNVEIVLAAVPFLRDQDLRRAVPGESVTDREDKIREGIYSHFQEICRLAKPLTPENVPLIATGHLYATGALASEKQDNIYLGNLENISAHQFPEEFNYIALGHIHRPQAIGGLKHIRYSGSLIPLSFSEMKDEKVVVCVEFSGKEISQIQEIPVPVFRRLKTMETSYEQVFNRIDELHERYKFGLPVWLEVIVKSDSAIPNLDSELREHLVGKNIDLLRTKILTSHVASAQIEALKQLEEVKPEEVFIKKCEHVGIPADKMEELLTSFRELIVWKKEVMDAQQ